jgi:hypothetical protein
MSDTEPQRGDQTSGFRAVQDTVSQHHEEINQINQEISRLSLRKEELLAAARIDLITLRPDIGHIEVAGCW